MFYTYVLGCKAHEKTNFYVGYTSDLRKRIKQHQEKGTATTKNADTLDLIYYEACVNKTDARKRELQLKTGFGRGYLKRRLKTYLETKRD